LTTRLKVPLNAVMERLGQHGQCWHHHSLHREGLPEGYDLGFDMGELIFDHERDGERICGNLADIGLPSPDI
jgi:hypothetical protein